MSETKKSNGFISNFIFINSLIIIGILAFFGYKFSQNEYSQNYYLPSDEMIETCRSSSFCYINDNSEFIDLISTLEGKSKASRYDFTLIVSSIHKAVKEESKILNTSDPVPFEDWQPHEIGIQRKYETLGDYCREADLCLSKKNVSLGEMVDLVKSISIGKKNIKFYLNENEIEQ